MPYLHGKSIIKIAVADDHSMFREALALAIDNFENCKVVIQASNGKELLEKLQQKPNTDLVLLDIRMPEMDGYETAKILHEKFPGIKILFCSVFKTELAICKMAGAGGNGFICKEASLQEIKKSIYEIMRNCYSFPNSNGGFLFNKDKNGSRIISKNNYQLSEKELQFMRKICTEKIYKQIASELGINDRQADYLRESLFSKFDVHCRVGLAVHAFESGISQLETA